MLVLDIPETRYKTVDELIEKSGNVLRRVYEDKVWSVINAYYEQLALGHPYQNPVVEGTNPVSSITFSGESVDMRNGAFQNPFAFPNQYIMEIFGETIENTNIQTPIFRTSRSFLYKLSVRKNYAKIVEDLVYGLFNDGLRNPYTYSISVIYFLELCRLWTLKFNRLNPDEFYNRSSFFDGWISRLCHDTTDMAVKACMMRNDRFGERYDLDTLLIDELDVIDHTICDTMWNANIGTDVYPLEDGLMDGQYEYYEDA